ncbi:U32 family peptidase [Bdellovibrio svalbardensis]|uniref:U32 family peptidase n=1 Tax=Bdellovibrio svalbardensis TaxID=2972972 RepID=A0ABT6DLF1_9BACT|nr:U32 family peptidase [Bdellovibrio svalbardensis]MDG0817702.1 U32 family peptidase [Bdellovibrio svalbardensis]
MEIQNLKRPELLLPVGTKDMALAAIHNGADAIFMGVPGFNARGRSHDFQIEEVKEIIDTCHLHGVKVNLAFNILVFQNELQAAVEVLEKILPLKPDAFIIQDLGLVQLVRKMAPWQRIHASTQMSITNAEAISWLDDLGIQRFVLARENSIKEIQAIKQNTTKEIEVFVHGALCVSYSGQCFTSEGIGGRSANRGQCAQSCRFTYEMHVDGEKRDLQGKSFLVSPQDLCGINEVPHLLEAGVDCFKVEGRLKTPEYVATAARSFDEAITSAQSNHALSSPVLMKKQMASAFSRGFYSGWFHGVNHQELVEGTFSSHRGFEFGKILRVNANSLEVEITDVNIQQGLKADFIKAGDGVLWVYKDRNGHSVEKGGFVFAVKTLSPRRFELEFSRDIAMDGIYLGARVFYNHDKDLKKDVTLSVEDKQRKKRLPVYIRAEASLGQPLKVQYSDGKYTVSATSENICEPAKSKGLNSLDLREELFALMGSPFRGEGFECELDATTPLFLPHRQIKELRQQLVKELTDLRVQNGAAPVLAPQNEVMDWIARKKISNQKAHGVKLNLLLRDKGQVEDVANAVKAGQLQSSAINLTILDFEFGLDFEPSLKVLKEQGLKVGIATTRILKPNEHRNVKHLLNLNPDAILARNLGAIQYLQANAYQGQILGDFSLNVANHLTAQYLLGKGISSVCLGYDLNHLQVSELIQAGQAERFEVTAYQYMPSFHMEHCVFAAFLSKGSSFKDCGKPCEKHDVKLKDQFGNWHQIKPDQECRNTMYNGTSQSAARYVKEWEALGLGYIRYEALKERGAELITKIQAHLDFIDGKKELASLIKDLGDVESYGLSESHFQREKEYQSRKK